MKLLRMIEQAARKGYKQMFGEWWDRRDSTRKTACVMGAALLEAGVNWVKDGSDYTKAMLEKYLPCALKLYPINEMPNGAATLRDWENGDGIYKSSNFKRGHHVKAKLWCEGNVREPQTFYVFLSRPNIFDVMVILNDRCKMSFEQIADHLRDLVKRGLLDDCKELDTPPCANK